MRKIALLPLFLGCALSLQAQTYTFTEKIDVEHQGVKNQGRTGTCWSFSTTSFVESEIERLSKKRVNLSEMYNVRMTYPKKAQNYVMRQGKAQFSEGGLAHDVINSIEANGLVPEVAYTGLLETQKKYDHHKVVPQIKKVLDVVVEDPAAAQYLDWETYTTKVLDDAIGVVPESFEYEGKTYTPKSFQTFLGFEPKDYVTLTSFTHAPFYSSFILNIPDNFSYGSFFNLPLEELVKITKEAVFSGFSVALDCDVSEATFSAQHGIAVLPAKKTDNTKSLTEIVPEKQVTAAFRENEFNNFHTTDDHLMHIVGWLEDQKGNGYFKVKNSWGADAKLGHGGYIYMSIPYFKAKVIGVLLHKEALPKKIKLD